MKAIAMNYLKTMSDRNKFILYTLAVGMVAAGAFAFAAPAAGTWGFEVYDVLVTRVLSGAIGFVAGVGAMVGGAIAAIQNKVFPGLVCIAGGVLMMNAESLLTTLGAIF